jgi:hypothetical protein
MASALSTPLPATTSAPAAGSSRPPVEDCLPPSACALDDPELQAEIFLVGGGAALELVDGALDAAALIGLATGSLACAEAECDLGLEGLAALVGRAQPTRPDAEAALGAGLAALAAADLPQAAAEFLRAAAEPCLRPAALQGLAAVLVAADRPRGALALAEFLVLAEVPHPAVSALAGWAACLTGDEGLTRRHMARTARATRTRGEHRALLRFAQRILLIQSFGS